eukprot:gene23563-biopygen8877
MFQGASRRAKPRLAPRVRSHPPRGPGARRGRMGPEVGPAFQRRYRELLGVRFTMFRNLSRVGARDLGIPAFAPRSEQPHARAPGAQMIRMASGRPLLIGGVTDSRSPESAPGCGGADKRHLNPYEQITSHDPRKRRRRAALCTVGARTRLPRITDAGARKHAMRET